MQYYTLKSKTIHCPFWDVDISISAKYRLVDNDKAQFQYGICPIIENNKLPEHKRNHELILYAFCKDHPCNELSSFAEYINLHE